MAAKCATLLIEIINTSIRKEAFREKNIQMTINPGTTPFSLHADPYLFERVVQNIIRNAAHSVRENGEAGIWFMTKENEHILGFFNSGIPIPAQYRESIFNKSSVGKKSYNKYSKGTGLYFCTVVMRAHQGRIWLETTENGNCFYVSFPAEKQRKAT